MSDPLVVALEDGRNVHATMNIHVQRNGEYRFQNARAIWYTNRHTLAVVSDETVEMVMLNAFRDLLDRTCTRAD